MDFPSPAARAAGARDPGARAKVAVLGTGAIGRDLVSKIHRSGVLSLGLVAGRNPQSDGLRHAQRLGYRTTTGGLDALLADGRRYDIVLDATNAAAHRAHWPRLEPLGCLVVDLTPSRIGTMVAPSVTGVRPAAGRNVNLISCGGQAGAPLAHALATSFTVERFELVSTVASPVAGRATRLNLDEYVATTAAAVTAFSGVPAVKAILNISPARPPVTFRTAVHAIIADADPEAVRAVAEQTAQRVRLFAPGYEVVACTVLDRRVTVSVQVTADSEVLPPYAGNLDIINSAAVMVAEEQAARLHRVEVTA